MDEIIKLLMNMGKTKEEALEFVGKEMPKGGIDDVGSNIIKPITKKLQETTVNRITNHGPYTTRSIW